MVLVIYLSFVKRRWDKNLITNGLRTTTIICKVTFDSYYVIYQRIDHTRLVCDVMNREKIVRTTDD